MTCASDFFVVGTVPGRLLGLPKEADASAGDTEAPATDAPSAAKLKESAKVKDASRSKETVTPKAL